MNKQNYSIFHKYIVIFLSSILFFFSLIYCYKNYVAVNWQEYGFYLDRINILEYIFCILLILFYSFLVPKFFDKPSSLFLIIIYIFVIIPSLVASISLPGRIDYYIMELTIFIGYTVASFLKRNENSTSQKPKIYSRVLSYRVVPIFVIIWMLLSVAIILKYHSIMRFSALDSIYLQRSEGSAENLLWGYSQMYFGYVFSPILLVIGLNKNIKLLIIAGFVGAIILYMITAEKAVFSMPIFIFITYIIVGLKSKPTFTSCSFLCLIFGLILFLSTYFNETSSIAEFASWYLGVRTFLIPGAFIVFYNNYFHDNGFTYFSHIRGIDIFVPAPIQYASDYNWPAIGKIVGENYLKIDTLNANANFIASDGIAAFGDLGIIIIFILLGFFLKILDKVSSNIHSKWTITMLLPLSLTLTNGSLFTIMTSSGGFLYLIIFYYFFNVKNYHNSVGNK